MKVLSIREPFASLIMSGDKKIETRSWKTKYRGEIYIHACGTKLDKSIYSRDVVKDLIKDKKFHFGNIICKANLVECVYMDEEFIKKIKKDKKEYACGRYEIGRYAWILEDVEIIKLIPAKGQLGIWNF